MKPPLLRHPPRSPLRVPRVIAGAVLVLGVLGCHAEVWVEGPDDRRAEAGAPGAAPAAVDTLYRPMRIDSAAASFAWVHRRPAPRLTDAREFPASAPEAARSFLRALAQTGSSSHGTIGVGELGYERAFTYVHPSVRGRRTARQWAASLAGVVRPAIVQLEPMPGDSTRVFAELAVLHDAGGRSLLGLYYGHFAARPGDNGWQLTAARLASEDWQSPLGGHRAWRYDRALAARQYAADDPAAALALIELESGEWVPIARPAPAADLQLGLPDLP